VGMVSVEACPHTGQVSSQVVMTEAVVTSGMARVYVRNRSAAAGSDTRQSERRPNQL
jgi:hypothetical protein